MPCSAAYLRTSSVILSKRLPFLNRRRHQVAVLGPTAVVVFHVVEAEQVFQHEPSVAGTFADAAIGNGVLLRINAFLLDVNGAQFVSRFECSIRRNGGAPGNALGAGDVSAALSRLTHAGRRDDFAGEFVRA